jgi:hypothetical protein
MHDDDVVSQGGIPNRISLRNIVLKSSFKQVQTISLNFVHLNPGSVVPHIGEMKEMFRDVNFQLVAVSGTWYKSKHTIAQVSLNGFRVIRVERGGARHGGGVAFYLKDEMRYKIISRLEPNSPVDYLVIELRLHRPLLACVIYNPPGVNGSRNREPTNIHGVLSCIDLFCTNRP